ncbi:MAG: hypothetical protein R3E66_03110 [bacterium]
MYRRLRRTLPLIVCAITFSSPTSAFAWDYLEHEWFTDVACDKAQTMLAERIEATGDEALIARYVALGLFCPVDDLTAH